MNFHFHFEIIRVVFQPDYPLIAKYCNMWRNYHDVATSWGAVSTIMHHYALSYDELAPHHAPGQWNDPDMVRNFLKLYYYSLGAL